jgi:hypothetical protein
MSERKQFTPDPNEVGTIWKKLDKNGKPFYSVEFNPEKILASGGRVMVFPLGIPNGPIFRIKSVPQRGEQPSQPRTTRFDDIPPSVADNDIPF